MKQAFYQPPNELGQRGGNERRDFLCKAMATHKIGSFWALINNVLPSLGDLEALLPRKTLPQIVNGQIIYTYRSGFSGDHGSERSVRTESASCAEMFLDVIAYISKNDPDFWDDLKSALESENFWTNQAILTDCAIALHLAEHDTGLIEKFIGYIQDADTFLHRIFDLSKHVGNNKYYPFDVLFQDGLRDVLDMYVRYKLAQFEEKRLAYSDRELDSVLCFIGGYKLHPKTVRFINTHFPLPESSNTVNRIARDTLGNDLKDNKPRLDYLRRAQESFATDSLEKKADVAQYILNMLAEAHGVHPAPSFEWSNTEEYGGWHTLWGEDKIECFRHPLGKVFGNPTKLQTFEDVLEALCHGFCHGLEDLSRFTLNPDFQKWFREMGEKEGVRLGIDSVQRGVQDAGLTFAFNSPSSQFSPLNGDGMGVPYYCFGEYYMPVSEAQRGGMSPEMYDKIDRRYRYQLRERHARSMGNGLRVEIESALHFWSLCNSCVSNLRFSL